MTKPCDDQTLKQRLGMDNKSKSKNSKKLHALKELLLTNERFEKKLRVQQNHCAFAVFFTIAIYLLLWYFSTCWAFPLQESPCKLTRDLPLFSTNQSTLAAAVDEFILALQIQFDKFSDVIEMPSLTDRLVLSTATKTEIGQLLSQHSADLVAFGALKREDERLKDVEEAIMVGYLLILLFLGLSAIFMLHLANAITACEKTAGDNETSTEESENSQKVRLGQLKRRIFFLHIATFICIGVEVALFLMAIVGQYFRGSVSLFPAYACRFDEIDGGTQETCPFTDYRNFSTELESNLDERLSKLDTTMRSPNLEVRQLTFEHQSEAIETAIEHHLSLKQYHVDRRTMPRKIGNVLPPVFPPAFFLILLVFLPINFVFFILWAGTEGSVWRVFKCFQVDLSKIKNCH